MSELLTKNENIIYQLETLASYEPKDLDNPEFDVAYELLDGSEPFATVCCIELATRVLKLIKSLEIKNDWISTDERLPTRFDSLHEDNQHIDCYIFMRNKVIERPWNIHHDCWDDRDYDDFEFDATEPSHWMMATQLPGPPKLNLKKQIK